MTSDHYVPEILGQTRRDKGITQRELAARVGVTEQSIIRAENGNGVSYKLLVLIANELQIHIRDVLRSNL